MTGSKDTSNVGESVGILIPIGVLVIVMIGTGVPWLMIPIGVLTIVFFTSFNERRKIRARQSEGEYWSVPPKSGITSGSMSEQPSYTFKPIYDQQKRKDEGVAVGLLLPIIFMLGFFLWTGAWPFLIPLFVLGIIFLSSLVNQNKNRLDVMRAVESSDARTIDEIADSSGVPTEVVRRHIVHEKRRGDSEVWFDSQTGTMTETPSPSYDSSATSQKGCPYCGFAMKPEDRFCPFCGAPVRASD